MAEQTKTAWLKPNDLPGGCQVTVWPLTDEGEPSDAPVTLETMGSYTELTNEDACRLGRALVAAADGAAVSDARERLARHLFLQERTDEWAAREWPLPQHVNQAPYLRRADAMLAVISGKEG